MESSGRGLFPWQNFPEGWHPSQCHGSRYHPAPVPLGLCAPCSLGFPGCPTSSQAPSVPCPWPTVPLQAIAWDSVGGEEKVQAAGPDCPLLGPLTRLHPGKGHSEALPSMGEDGPLAMSGCGAHTQT